MEVEIVGTQVGIGVSHHRNPVMAAKEAVEKAQQHGSIQHPDFVLMFSMVGYPQDVLLKTVYTAVGQVPLIGCSGAGTITTGEADESNFGVVLLLFQSDDVQIHHGMVTDIAQSSAAAGQQLATDVRSHLASDTQALLLFADGIVFNFDDFSRGLGDLSIAGRSLPIIGGLAGDNLVYEKTYQYYNNQVLSEGMVWATLSGQIKLVSAISHGCVPIGQRHIITKCDRNVIYEVDHRPILEQLKDYLHVYEIEAWDKTATNLGLAFPSTETTANDDDYIIYSMISKDDATASVALQSEVKEGDEFWVARRDFTKIRDGIEEMANSLETRLGNDIPRFILQVECDGRGKAIFQRHEKLELLEILQTKLGVHLPWIGLYAYGEIAPFGKHNQLHNFSSIVTAIC